VFRTTIEVTVEVEIARPRAAVWAFVTDTERVPEWVEEFEEAHVEPPGAVGLGATIQYRLTRGGRSGTYRIIEWEPERTIAWDGPPLRYRGGGARPRGSFLLTDTAEGRTRFTAHYRPELTGALVLMRPAWGRWLRRQRQVDAERMKALVERS
jgi:uncharacterized protein YndB with AHSA1/START domain